MKRTSTCNLLSVSPTQLRSVEYAFNYRALIVCFGYSPPSSQPLDEHHLFQTLTNLRATMRTSSYLQNFLSSNRCWRRLTGLIQLGLISYFLCPIHLWPSPLAMETTRKRVSYIIFDSTYPATENPPVPFSFAQRTCAGFAQLGKKHSTHV